MARSTPLWKSPWFWGAAGAVLVIGVRDSRRQQNAATRPVRPQPPKPQGPATPPRPSEGVVLRYKADGSVVTLSAPGRSASRYELSTIQDPGALAGFAANAAYSAVVKYNKGREDPNWTLIVEVPPSTPNRAEIASQIQRTVQQLNTPRSADSGPIEPGSTPIGQRPLRNDTLVRVLILEPQSNTTSGPHPQMPLVPLPARIFWTP